MLCAPDWELSIVDWKLRVIDSKNAISKLRITKFRLDAHRCHLEASDGWVPAPHRHHEDHNPHKQARNFEIVSSQLATRSSISSQ
jgi:hypothetical protein